MCGKTAQTQREAKKEEVEKNIKTQSTGKERNWGGLAECIYLFTLLFEVGVGEKEGRRS